MLTKEEKIAVLESRIEQIDFNVRDNIVQIEDIRSVNPVDQETVDAINFHIDQWTLKKTALQSELDTINISS